MRSATLIFATAMTAYALATAAASAQNKPAPGPFDGKWVGE